MISNVVLTWHSVALGLIIGAIFVEFANWSWAFWFVAIVSIPIGLLCTFLVPNPVRSVNINDTGKARWKTLDLVGVSILTGMCHFCDKL